MREKQPILSADRLSADRLRRLHEDASRLMSRPFSATPSEEAAESLEPLLRPEKIEAAEPAVRGGVGRLVGTSFHRMMERWDLDATPEAELERQIEIQVRWLRRQSGDDRHEEAETQFRQLTDRFEGSRIWERFVGLRSAVVGREVPVILPPDRSTLQPLGYVAGSIDLVARDDQGRFTVIDFKTDAIEQPEEIRLRAEAYHRQEMLYATALAESLDLGDLPDCQLWFIWPDHLWNNSDPTPS